MKILRAMAVCTMSLLAPGVSSAQGGNMMNGGVWGGGWMGGYGGIGANIACHRRCRPRGVGRQAKGQVNR